MLELVLSKPYKPYKLYPRRTVQNQKALNKIKPSNHHHKEQESNYSLELRQQKNKCLALLMTQSYVETAH